MSFLRRAAAAVAFLTLSLGIVFGAAPSRAADAAEPPAAAAPPDDAVSEWSIEATQRLSEIRERLSVQSDLQKLEGLLAALEKRFDANLGNVLAHPDSAHGLTEAAIRDAKSELDAVSTGVTSISNILAQRSATLEAVSKETADMMKRAQALRVPGAAPQPEAIVKRLDSIVSEAKRLLQSAQQRLDRAAQLQNRLLVLQDRARTADSDLTEVGAERLRALIQVQQPPLWRVHAADIAGSAAGSTYFVGQAVPGALQFLQDNISRAVLHIGVFVSGFVLVTYLRRRFGSEKLGGRSSRAATRPYSAAALLMLLASPFVYPEAPSSVLQMLGLLSIVPMVRILNLYLAAANCARRYTRWPVRSCSNDSPPLLHATSCCNG